MEKERCMQILNGIVDSYRGATNASTAVKCLVHLGFTKEELVSDFGFSKQDVYDGQKGTQNACHNR